MLLISSQSLPPNCYKRASSLTVISHQTAVVFFDVKAAKLEKARQKLRIKIAGQKVGLEKMVVEDIYKDQFQFTKIEVAGSN